jgi:hypothetical protein
MAKTAADVLIENVIDWKVDVVLACPARAATYESRDRLHPQYERHGRRSYDHDLLFGPQSGWTLLSHGAGAPNQARPV